jgi:hypothetical protein
MLKDEAITPYISYSLIYYLNDVYNQILKIEDSLYDIKIDFINKIVNPFEFIYTNVPGTTISVSKVKPESNIFFELMELFQVCNINEMLALKKKINICHLTPNFKSTNYLLNMYREENEDIIINDDFNYDKICDKFVFNQLPFKFDLFIFEFKEDDYNNTSQYLKNMVLVLFLIIKYQSHYGTSIIKIDNIYYKPVVDILFIFSGIFEKVYLIKPSISKIAKGERFIICKNLNLDMLSKANLTRQIEEHIGKKIVDGTIGKINIHSVINNDVPYYFLNKIEECNAVIGQQQLESYDQVINIFKNKNKEEKIETLKRNHIQKCIQWCEKNQLPHNKFTDKINIFLNTKKKDNDEEMKPRAESI